MKKDKTTENGSSFVIFKTEDEQVSVDVRFEEETIWLTQDQIASLFGVERPGITQHIKNIFTEEELQENSVSKKFLRTATDGKNYQTKHYNLDMIISLGYRVNSKVATQFRIWATKRLNEYIRKGFTMDDDRLKNLGGGGYWKELLQRIRDIRASEKVQNKIHYAIHGQTAAEVIFNRVDAEKEFMGLMTFSGNQPSLKDVGIAKNYLNEKELRALGQIVSGYLDFAERQAEREEKMTMNDWASHLDRILTMSGEKLLQGAGKISHDQAIEKATSEYKRCQNKTLSAAEKNYLESLKAINQKARKK